MPSSVTVRISTTANVSTDALLEYAEAALTGDMPDMPQDLIELVENTGLEIEHLRPRHGQETKVWPDRAETLIYLREWALRHDGIKQTMSGLERTLGDMAGSPLFEALWGIFEAYTNQIADRIGDAPPNRWMEWYQFETNMGAKPMDAGYDDNTRPIQSLETLADLIIEGRDYQ